MTFGQIYREKVSGAGGSGAMRWQEVQAYLDGVRYPGPYIVIDDDVSGFPVGWKPLLLYSPETGLDAGRRAELAACLAHAAGA